MLKTSVKYASVDSMRLEWYEERKRGGDERKGSEEKVLKAIIHLFSAPELLRAPATCNHATG